MNLALSTEQELLKEAARGTLSRFDTVAAARSALEGEPLPDLWPAACTAGWPGLLISEERGGAGLGSLEAMLVFEEMGRVLASVPLLGHLPATLLLDAAAAAPADLLEALSSGERRVAYVPARPPSDVEDRWTVDPVYGSARAPAPTLAADGSVSGTVAWVPDAPGADVLVVVATDGMQAPRAVVVDPNGVGVDVEALWRYDATRPLGHVRLERAEGTPLDAPEDRIRAAWYLAGALVGAESLGAVERALEASVQYAKERFTFGRAIGSYQAVKHQLVEVLRRLGNARSLMYYAGWAGQDRPEELALAASAFRLCADRALDEAARTQVSVHGGIGATWEHDAPLYFRRAQLSRRLLAGTADAADRVAAELFEQARSGGAVAAA